MRMAELLVCLPLFAAAPNAFAQGTAFSYQGCLKTSGQPANGSYDFRFRLVTDPLGNTYVGSPCIASGIPVSNSLFMTTMDFGPGIFTGTDYWLEVAVRTNGAFTDYTVLAPHQSIAPSPYAIFAATAGNLTGAIAPAQLPAVVVTNGASSVSLSGTFSGDGTGLSGVALLAGGNTFSGNQTFSEGNVGIGTNKPATKLVVAGTVTAANFSGDGGGLTNVISASQGDYLFAYANSGVQSEGTFTAFKYAIGPGTNINFNSRGPFSDWTVAPSPVGPVFVAAHTGVYWVQFTVSDTYLQGGGYPHFQAVLNGVKIPGSQCTPIYQGSTTTAFITPIKAGERLAIQCTPYSTQTLGTFNAGYFASLNILRIK